MALRVYYFTVFAALGVYVPFFPSWLQARGLSGLSLSVVAGLLPAFGVIAPPLFGMAADAFGLRGSLLRVACGGAFVAFAGLALAGLAGYTLGFWLIFAGVLLYALFRAPMVLMADVVLLEQKGTRYGRVRLWGSIGFMLAAFGAGSFIDSESVSEVPLAIALLLLSALAASLALSEKARLPPRPVIAEARALLASNDFRLFACTIFLWQASHASYDLCISLHLRDLGASGPLIGVCWAIGTAAEVVLMLASGSLLTRYAPASLLAFALATTALRWLLVATLSSPLMLLLLQPLHALSFGLVWVAAMAWVRERAASHALATAQGLTAAFGAIGGTTAMLGWGPLYAASRGGALFSCAAVVAMLGAACAVALGRSQRSLRAHATAAG